MDARFSVWSSGLAKAAFGLMLLTAWSSPRTIENADFRSSLRIKPIITNRRSPALAALEDIRLNFVDSSATKTIAETEPLKIGRHYGWNSKPHAKINLPPVVISQNTKVDHLRQLVGEVDDKASTEVTMTDYAEILVKEELLRRQHENKSAARVITSSTGTIITVAPALATAPALVTAQVPTVTPQRGQAIVTIPTRKISPQPPVMSAAQHIVASAEKPTGSTSGSIPVIFAANIKPAAANNPFAPETYEISGALTFEKGAAMLGGRQNLTIQQLIDGQIVAAGDINFIEASYHIALPKLEGELVASVRDQNGQLIAEGRADLSTVAESNINQHRIKEVSLSIVPATSQTEVIAVAAGALGGRKAPITGAHILAEGLEREIAYNKKQKAFVDSTLVSPSTLLMRAEAANYWPTIGIVQSGERAELQLLPLKLIEALLSLTLDKYGAREAVEQGVIWGHVLMGGQPIEGAQVGVVGESEKKPVYFSGFIPDKTRHSTAAGGEFSFTRLEPGEKMLRVNLSEKIFWPVLLPIQKKAVTYADLQIEPRRGITFKSFQAFSSAPTAAQVQPLGTNEEMLVPDSGVARIENETINGISFFEANADPTHETMRASLRSGQVEVRFPFVTKEWMAKARAKLGLNADASTGSAFFFVNGDDYDVIIGPSAGDRAQNIVYFDAAGDLASHPVDGGGFAVLNLPPGFHAITVIPEKSKKVVSELVYVDSYAVAAETLNLMY